MSKRHSALRLAVRGTAPTITAGADKSKPIQEHRK
jgi:hypothetical protein